MTKPEIQWRDDIVVNIYDGCGNDASILRAMLVSSDKDERSEWEDSGTPGNRARLNALMRDRHGSPFEHSSMSFYVEAPIFVFREWHRHRIGVSINEQSGRYSELPPMFYLPRRSRPLVKVEGSKQMEYKVEQANDEQYTRKLAGDMTVMRAAYEEYQRQLADGIVKESARNCLPVAIYSKMVWTCNPRSIMAFLSLRQRFDAPEAKFPSKPQWEINQAADILETIFSDRFPITHEAFVRNGRVCP